MMRQCRLDPALKWIKLSDRELVPILDGQFLEWLLRKTGHGCPTGQAVYRNVLVLWADEVPPVTLFRAIDDLKTIHGDGLVAVHQFGPQLRLAWRDAIPVQRSGELYLKVGGVEWETRSITLALFSREDILQSDEAQNPGFVYVLKGECNPPVYKIGRSRDVPSRVNTLGILLPYSVELIHTIPTNWAREAEAYYHGLFRNSRLNGEWFQLTPSQLQVILSDKAWEMNR